MKITKLQKEIIKTLLFFNLHKRPLSTKEVYQYLGVKAQESQIFLALLDLCRKNKVIEKNQYFTLKKYQGLFKTFNQRLKIKQKLEAKARKFIWFFKLIPYVRAIFLANSLAMGLPNKKSDIDLVILTYPNRLWTARLFLNFWFSIFGLKRKKDVRNDPGKFCFSFLMDLKNLELKKIKLINDPYLTFWVASLKPLLINCAQNLFWENNIWINQYLPNLKIANSTKKSKSLSFTAFLQEKIFNLCGDFLENKLFVWQTKNIKIVKHKDNNFIDRGFYKIHPKNKRQQIAQKLGTELKKLI